MDWLNFRHLYAFWMVSHTRNFTKAAKKMRVAQSAVSEQVSQLEAYFNEKLFVRTTRNLELTNAGKQLLNYAQIIFETSRDINLVLKEKEQPLSANHLSIGVVGGVSRNFLFRLLEQFVKNNSKIQINVTTGSFTELTTQLKNFELDLILTLELPRKKDLSEFTYQKISQSPLCLAGSRRLVNSLKSRKRCSPVDLYKFSHPYETEIVQNIIQPILKTDLRLILSTDDIPLLRFFANSKKGLVVIPQIGILEDIEMNKVDYWVLEDCTDVNIYGVYVKQAIHENTVRNFLGSIKEINF